MKIQIRRNIFETNSSSVHNLTLLTDNEYNLWVKGAIDMFGYADDEDGESDYDYISKNYELRTLSVKEGVVVSYSGYN